MTVRIPRTGALGAILLLATTALTAACSNAIPDISASDVPAKPVFWTDVLPLLDDHCNLCHSRPTNYGAPGGFRLDQYAKDTKHNLRGAQAMASQLEEEIKGDSMPPAAAWGDGVGKNGKKLIALWVKQGAAECNTADDCPDAGQTCTTGRLCQ